MALFISFEFVHLQVRLLPDFQQKILLPVIYLMSSAHFGKRTLEEITLALSSMNVLDLKAKDPLYSLSSSPQCITQLALLHSLGILIGFSYEF